MLTKRNRCDKVTKLSRRQRMKSKASLQVNLFADCCRKNVLENQFAKRKSFENIFKRTALLVP